MGAHPPFKIPPRADHPSHKWPKKNYIFFRLICQHQKNNPEREMNAVDEKELRKAISSSPPDEEEIMFVYFKLGYDLFLDGIIDNIESLVFVEDTLLSRNMIEDDDDAKNVRICLENIKQNIEFIRETTRKRFLDVDYYK